MFGRKTKVPKTEDFGRLRTYDYSTPEARVATAEWLFADAKTRRTAQEFEWTRCNDYYNFVHGVTDEVREWARENGIEWDAAVVPDPFIIVDSQIDTKVPEPEFRGRDDDMDDERAKEREFAVRYIIQENRLEDKLTSNERRLKKLGDAFWKVYWDPDMPCGPREGNIRIVDVPVEALYVDPTVGNEGIQAAQYVVYVYRIHKLRFWQRYHKRLTDMGLDLDEVVSGDYRTEGGLFDLITPAGEDDTVQVMEFWYRQPYDAEGVPAGAVACTIQAGGHEIDYIPNYWTRTGEQNQNTLFPFVHVWCIRDENQFYNKSELFSIFSLVDAADRALASAQFNETMLGNDVILCEEEALVEGEQISNEPGAIVRLRKNAMGKVQRLGGLHTASNSLNLVNAYIEQIQRATRNYDQNLGKETTRVTTASGLLQLRSDANTQNELKRADRNRGFARLYELCDWSALEFFDDDRLLFIGAREENGRRTEAMSMTYNGENYAQEMPPMVDMVTGEQVRAGYSYYPRVDVTVNAGDGIARSKAATLEVLDKLAAIQPTEENWRILAAELDILDIPQKQEIIQMWEDRFQPAVPAEVEQALQEDPALLQQVMEMVAQRSVAQELGADQGDVLPAGDDITGLSDVSMAQSGAPLGGEIE